MRAPLACILAAAFSLAAVGCSYQFGAEQECERDDQCPAASSCVGGRCTPCPSCASGEVCLAARCFAERCVERRCPAGEGCIDGVCADRSCVGVSCPAGSVCANGTCYPRDCAAGPCAPDSACVGGGCEALSCIGVLCAAGEVCANGACFPADCPADDCASGAACIEGACRPASCAGVECAPGTACAAGGCVPQDCLGAPCQPGEACVDGSCTDPDCAALQCPLATYCDAAACRPCQPNETSCGGGQDEDCDGPADCADPDCLDQTCGSDLECATRACSAGGLCESRAKPAGAVCRAALPGGCDREEQCDGTSLVCPTDQVAAGDVVCRARTGPCDATESCTGSSPLCPADLPQTPCTPAVLSLSDDPAYDYGAQRTGTVTSKIFTVTNLGGYDATLGEVSAAGLGLAAPFALSAGDCASGSVLAPAGTCTLQIDFAPTAPGGASDSIDLAYGDGQASQTASRAVSGLGVGPPEALSLAGPGTVTAGACSRFTVASIDALGSASAVAATVRIDLAGPADATFHGESDPACTGAAMPSVALAAGASSASFHFRATLAGQKRIGATEAGAALAPASLAVTVVNATATRLAFDGDEPADPSAIDTELALRVRILDAFDNPVTSGPDAAAPISVALTAGTGTLLGTLSAAPSGGTADFAGSAVRVDTLGPGKVITATKPDTSGFPGGSPPLSTSTLPFEVVEKVGWVGSEARAVWMASGGQPGAAVGDGMFGAPVFNAVDGSHLYVVDEAYRVLKLDLSTGTFVGWLGSVGIEPTGGGPGCASLARGEFTNAWCTGGEAAMASGGGRLYHPAGIHVDTNWLYVSDEGYDTINRYDKVSGAFAGWIGTVASRPTGPASGGPATCATSSIGQAAPGWCIGGAAGNGASGDGHFGQPHGLAGDATYLYVADAGNNRIARIAKATGAWAGWVGRIATAASGSAPGNPSNCAAAAPGSAAPGWCLGGTAQAGAQGDGSLTLGGSEPGVGVDATHVYVTDGWNGRVNRYEVSTGAPAGWIGRVLTPPTGPGAPCTLAVAGDQTPGWCTGGTASPDYAAGGFHWPSGLLASAGQLYVADTNKLTRFDATTGQLGGWLGATDRDAMPTSPAACAALSPGAFTGRWCLGGAADYGIGDGMLTGGRGVALDASRLFVSDEGRFRVQAYDLVTGAFVGWTGTNAVPTGGWRASGLAAGAFDDASFFGPMGLWIGGGSAFVVDRGRLKRHDLKSGTAEGWVGRIGAASPTSGAPGCAGLTYPEHTPGWCRGGEATAADMHDGGVGAFDVPTGFTGDGTWLYATSPYAVHRFRADSGAFGGWIGAVGTTPSSSAAGNTADCTQAQPGSSTPGWCIGGSSREGAADGQFDLARAVHFAGGYLYVGDRKGRVQRLRASDGSPAGWIGRVGTTPTGGAAGCASAAPGTVTPGWCEGGAPRAAAGTYPGDGSLGDPVGVAGDAGYLYVVDGLTSQLVRFQLESGAFSGWVGGIAQSPTGPVAGGPPGCATAVPGTATPGWCVGGASAGYDLDGALSFPRPVHADGRSVFVGEGGSDRISRFDAATGAFSGWKGWIDQSPAGGEAGCAGAPHGSLTPGWCRGGRAGRFGGAQGASHGIGALSTWGNLLYLTDVQGCRLMRMAR